MMMWQLFVFLYFPERIFKLNGLILQYPFNIADGNQKVALINEETRLNNETSFLRLFVYELW